MPDIDIILSHLNEIKERLSGIPVSQAEPAPEIITGEVLCERLGVTHPTLLKMRKANRIPFILLGKSIRYNYPRVISALESDKRKAK